MYYGLRLTCVTLLAALSVSSGSAQESTPFYKGKQVRIILSAGMGGGFYEYAKLMSIYMPKHMAGNPDILVQSMPGAGGLLATNYLYSQAPQDGTTFGIVHSSIPLAPLFGAQGARFDPRKFHWLGSLDRSDGPCTAWHTSPVKTWADMLQTQFMVGSAGAGSPMDIYPAVLNKLFGTKIKVIGGYKDGASIFFAMERGEIHGRCGAQSAIKAIHPDWLTEGKVVVPIVVGRKRNPDFPNSPSIMEFVQDKDEMTRQQLELLFASQDFDRPVLAPPGVPKERAAELRDAFNATMTDPAFRANIDKMNLGLDWVRGDEVEKILAGAYAMPAEVVAATKETMYGK